MKRSVITKLCLSLALGTPIIASAADSSSSSGLGELQKQMDRIFFVSPNGTCGATTAIARPILENDCNQCCTSWFLQLSILYWKARVNGTDFAYSIGNSAGQFPISGRLKEMEFDWDFGLKFGMGYNLPHDGWDMSLVYTWFDTHASKGIGAARNNAVIPDQGNSSISNLPDGYFAYCSKGKSQFDFVLNSLDFEMGRYYYVSEHLALRPQIGAKAGWLKLAQVIRYTGGAAGAAEGPTGLDVNTVRVKGRSEFFGLGPRAGAYTNWHICNCFSVFGNVTAALLYGNFDVLHKNDYSRLKCLNAIKLVDKFHAFIPNLEFQIGVQFDRYFNEDMNHARVQINLDSQYFWRVNQMLRANQLLSLGSPVANYSHISEDLGMYGITATLRLDF